MKWPIAICLLLITAQVASAADPRPKTDDEKTLYAIGIAISRNLTPFSLTPSELAFVQSGIADGVAEKAEDDQAAGARISDFLQARVAKTATVEKKAGEEFLAKAAAEKGAKKQSSGLIYTEIKAGDGKQPKESDQVKVHYKGTLRDGTVFDSSIERGKPAEFPLHGVIPCWGEGLQLMKEHGKAKLICPPELAYGDHGAPPKIKPGAALVFEVELLEVTEGKAPVAEDLGDPHQPAAKPAK